MVIPRYTGAAILYFVEYHYAYYNNVICSGGLPIFRQVSPPPLPSTRHTSRAPGRLFIQYYNIHNNVTHVSRRTRPGQSKAQSSHSRARVTTVGLRCCTRSGRCWPRLKPATANKSDGFLPRRRGRVFLLFLLWQFPLCSRSFNAVTYYNIILDKV